MKFRISCTSLLLRCSLPAKWVYEKLYIVMALLLLLVISNIVLLYNQTDSRDSYEIVRPKSSALLLYEENDLNNPRIQRTRNWLITDLYGAELVEELSKHKSYQKFDPRLATSIWLNMINENLQDSEELLPPDFTLPFTWNMVLDLSAQLLSHPYYDKIIKAKLSCEQFCELDPELNRKYQNKLFPVCVDYNYEEPNFLNVYDLPFKLTGGDHVYMEDVEMRKIYAIIHCLTGLEIPSKVLFLGAIDNMGFKKSLIVPLLHVTDTDHNLRTNEIKHSVLKEFSNQYIERQLQRGDSIQKILTNGMSSYHEMHKLNEFILKTENSAKILSNANIDSSFGKPTVFGIGENAAKSEPLSMGIELFNWNIDLELEALQSEIPRTLQNSSLIHLQELLLDRKENPNKKEQRYWGIASSKADRLDHFDFRFFRSNVKSEHPELHQAVLHRLTRAWFKLCHELDVPTWLNHGPLIGWYWNGISLPYDADIDVQLPIQSLAKMAKLINGTLIYDFVNEGEYFDDELKLDNNAELGFRSFYFEVANSFVSRTNILSLQNNIDARLIDTQTGMYIDITALLSFTSHTDNDIPSQVQVLNKMKRNQINRFILSQYYDDFYEGIELKKEVRNLEGTTISRKILQKSNGILNDYINAISEKQKVLSTLVHDRNYHFYNLNELSPLIPSFHENYNTYIPSNFLKNLIVEYGSKLVMLNPRFLDYMFFSDLKLWIKHEVCPVYEIADNKWIFTMDEKTMNEKCFEMSDKVKDESKHLKSYLEFHQQELDTLLGGFSRNETLLNEIMMSNLPLDLMGHQSFIQNHNNHILFAEPNLVQMFY